MDAAYLHQMVAQGLFPVVHVGQPEAVTALHGAAGLRWLVVYLWCPREEAARRAAERDTGDLSARLQAWDETPALPSADLEVNTANATPDTAAAMIDDALRSRSR
ncbi:hypothetical protein [Amycolatopsis suaedae]|uniref:hypothetical protein n=1 Tax=Amycolatopsis suaedae TaxID=2510978 RepID=UPI00196AC9DA|nr:hypothetical protein [Amycolatopsis suaedae]